jgi:predicted DsbA family dithiol-disulfide isomerase
VQETFAQEGLQYNIDGMTGNTLDSHRLIAHAAKEGPERQNALVEGLFKAYFTEVRSFSGHLSMPLSCRSCMQSALLG